MDLSENFIKVMFTDGTYQLRSKPESKGKNGNVQTSGVELYADDEANLVRISPVTSRGAVSPSCYIEVPFDRATLQALAEKFARLALFAPS